MGVNWTRGWLWTIQEDALIWIQKELPRDARVAYYDIALRYLDLPNHEVGG